MKDFKTFNKLKFSDIVYNNNKEVFITLLYNDKNLEKFGIVKSRNIIGMMDETDSFIKGLKCHVSGYNYAYLDFDEAEDLNTTSAIASGDFYEKYMVFSNYEDALYFYNDNI